MMHLDPSTLCLACRHIRHRHTGPCDVCNCPTFVEAVPPQHAPWQTTIDNLDAGTRYLVRCPDGIERVLWGANRQTGDLCIAGWPGDAWMDCSSGALHVEFDTHTPGKHL